MNSTTTSLPPAKIWWSNGIFFVSIHVAAICGMIWMPPFLVPRATLLSAFVLWQLGEFGITIGYHRLYSHRSFSASLPVRIALAACGSSAFQGSIKWWCLRHRLHHRFTDDTVHDPYAATRGLLWSHMGWIFFKSNYERMELVDRGDLDADPVVRFQHKYYIPLAAFLGFVVPPLLGYCWGDAMGGFIYGGLVTRLAIWHCTFFINSLAHWDGLQPYSDENTSRSNLILAILTCGEGNHNYHHAFPYDYRSGPSRLDWDPSKWIIAVLHRLRLVKLVRRARFEEVREAKWYMHGKTMVGFSEEEQDSDWTGQQWTTREVIDFVASHPRKCMMIIDGFVLDVTNYMKEHPGGAKVLREYSVRSNDKPDAFKDASWAFRGGLNNHSRVAKKRMGELRVAKLIS